MRTPWQADFPSVFVHAGWEAGSSILPDHPGYWPAKKKRDPKAALAVCESVCRESVLEEIYDHCFSQGGDLPIVVAPALTLHETQNALAIGYAKWLAVQMRWEQTELFQAKTMSKDFSTAWFRLAHEPSFYGTVQKGRRYVIADDVCTMGGTIAAMRGYIHAHGGNVICATTLASGNGQHSRISLASPTRCRLTSLWEGAATPLVASELGYELVCLTEAEGQFLLRCPSAERFREGLNGARNS